MRRIGWKFVSAALVCFAGSPAALAAPAAHVPGDYVYVGSIDLGAPGGWDYASFADGRLYIGHASKIDVVDLASGKVVGSAGPLNEGHGAAADIAIGRGFATSGGDGIVKEFSLTDFSIVKDIPVGSDADGIVLDPSTGAVLVTRGDAKQLVIIDAKAGAIAHQVDLPGEPEFLAPDGHGKVFVNITSTGELSKVDIASGKVEATWPLTGCRRPHGLAYDHRTRRLFAGCANAVVVAVDPRDGRVLATLPAGSFNDAMLVDEKRGRVFCPNADGT
ncbi:MAG TPA: PQQ-binding-like beta-propeller repeat protein, partial [Caulobacteraceae bacterium]|nr:PQQ-binding-like beta-propeller repeat protein [Caulobacteraceae bacterium]